MWQHSLAGGCWAFLLSRSVITTPFYFILSSSLFPLINLPNKSSPLLLSCLCVFFFACVCVGRYSICIHYTTVLLLYIDDIVYFIIIYRWYSCISCTEYAKRPLKKDFILVMYFINEYILHYIISYRSCITIHEVIDQVKNILELCTTTIYIYFIHDYFSFYATLFKLSFIFR